MQIGAASLSKISSLLVLEEPYYGYFMLGLPKSEIGEGAALGIRLFEPQMLQLVVGVDQWVLLSPEEQCGCVKKALLHFLFRHPLLQKKYTQTNMFHLAAELLVNQYLSEKQQPNPDLTIDFFNAQAPDPSLVFEPDQTVANYYQKLLDWQAFYTQISFAIALPMEIPPILAIINAWAKGGNKEQLAYHYWSELDLCSPAERLVLEHFIKKLSLQAWQRCQTKPTNTLPLGVLRAIQAAGTTPSTVSWQKVLRQFAASSNSSFLKNTIRRPSKRYGTTPGVRVQRYWALAVALDTSGSISPQLSQLFFNEIRHLWRLGAKITVIECAAAIGRIYSYRGQAPAGIAQGGATDLNPPIEWANESMPDALIYFTDGLAAAPEVQARMPLLWVTPKMDGFGTAHLPGRKISMEGINQQSV
jgi:hypothetical protein